MSGSCVIQNVNTSCFKATPKLWPLQLLTPPKLSLIIFKWDMGVMTLGGTLNMRSLNVDLQPLATILVNRSLLQGVTLRTLIMYFEVHWRTQNTFLKYNLISWRTWYTFLEYKLFSGRPGYTFVEYKSKNTEHILGVQVDSWKPRVHLPEVQGYLISCRTEDTFLEYN